MEAKEERSASASILSNWGEAANLVRVSVRVSVRVRVRVRV